MVYKLPLVFLESALESLGVEFSISASLGGPEPTKDVDAVDLMTSDVASSGSECDFRIDIDGMYFGEWHAPMVTSKDHLLGARVKEGSALADPVRSTGAH